MSASNGAGQFAGKVVAITGGTQGVGEAVARLMVERGAAGLTLAGRTAARGEALAAELSDLGTPTVFVQADMAKVADCQRFIDTTEQRFGRLDALVNCAADTGRGRVENTTEEVWDSMFAVNVKAPFFLIQRAVEVMRRHKIAGAVANIGTIVAYGGPPFLIPYSSSKGALMTMTRAVANALKYDRIRVNTVNIGWTNTPREHLVQTKVHGKPENWLQEESKHQPFGRLVEPAEIARAIAYLTSEESGLLTGAVFELDQVIIGTMDDQPDVFPPTDFDRAHATAG